VPTIQANGLYENVYLMGTSIARPCIIKNALKVAKKVVRGGIGEDRRLLKCLVLFAGELRFSLARRDWKGKRPSSLRTGRVFAGSVHQDARAVASSRVFQHVPGFCFFFSFAEVVCDSHCRKGRDDMIDFAKQNGIPVSATKRKPYSTDENMFHISYESGILVITKRLCCTLKSC